MTMTADPDVQPPAGGADLAGLVGDDLIARLAGQARAQGVSLVGEGGLLQQLTKRVLEAALEGEMDSHLGSGKHERAGRTSGNARNGRRAKTVLTEAGPVELDVPRDRDGSFTPQIVRKRQRRLSGVDDLVISLTAKGLTTGEVSAHLAEVYGADVSKETISTITDRVLDSMGEWQSRPLDRVYPVVFIDAIQVKIRDGQVANRPIYVALAVTVDGHRDILGMWAGGHGDGEGAKFWLRVLTEIRNRGTQDVCIVVCDGLKGLPDAVATVWPRTVVQTCIVHRSRKETRCCSRVRSSLIWYGHCRGDAQSAGGEMCGVVAASERAATTSDAGDRGAAVGKRRGACGGSGGRGQRDHGPQGRLRVGGRRRTAGRRPGAQAGWWPQDRC